MKRDMDLIRTLLLQIEEKDDGTGRQVQPDVNGRKHEEVVEHLFMLNEAGLIDGRDASVLGGRDIAVLRMTWYGHEFLDSIRDPEIWRQTKEGVEKAGGFTFEVLAAVAKGLVKEKIKKHTGVEVDL